ncbi:MAG: ribosomal protein L11 methyltransferase [Parvicellaceae bacterium]|jgi:ribosomal protein L11 methyltransferase
MNYVELDFKLDPLLPAREVLVYELGELLFESFVNTDAGIKAYIPIVDFDEDLLNGLMTFDIPDLNHSYVKKVIEQQNWNATWEQDFQAIYIEDKCVIRAPFHSAPPEGMMDLVISPKMSFGTGHHQTTYMMASQLFKLDLVGKSVLDMGCGTAILAIIAKKRGAEIVWGIDIEDFAYENAKENVKLNSVSQVIVYKGGVEKLNSQSFHLILANINRNILLEDMGAYCNVLETNGRICFSGFFTTDIDVLKEHAKNLGLVFEDKQEKEGWAMLSFLKK